MNERMLREALREAPLDDGARERSRRVVRAAYRELPPPPPRPRARRRWIAAAVAACLAAMLATNAVTRAPTDALAQWLRDVVGAGEGSARPLLGDVPGGGRLLVVAGRSAWVVAPDGGKRRLGRYDGASWSPRGLFAIAWHGGELTALEPDGDVRWSLRRPREVRAARWSPGDGYRIAYLAGRSLRIVNGDGTGDRRFAAARADVAPAWRPSAGHVLAYVDERDRVHVTDVDRGQLISRFVPLTQPRALAWSPAGDRLLLLTARSLVLLDPAGRVLAERALTPGTRGGELAWSSRGGVALVQRDAMANRSDVVLLDGTGARRRVLFTAPGTLGPIAWSPDGRLLLVAWPDADQWLFLAPERRRPTRAVADVAAQFAPGAVSARFPASVQWAPAPGP